MPGSQAQLVETEPTHERILVTLGADQIHQFNHLPFVCQRVRNDDVIVASNRIQSDSHAKLVGNLLHALQDVLARVIDHMRDSELPYVGPISRRAAGDNRLDAEVSRDLDSEAADAS